MGELPFNDITAERIMIKTIKSSIDFDYQLYNKLSLEVKDLLKQMLIKIPEKRITLKNCRNHKWFDTNISNNKIKHCNSSKTESPNKSPTDITIIPSTNANNVQSSLDNSNCNIKTKQTIPPKITNNKVNTHSNLF